MIRVCMKDVVWQGMKCGVVEWVKCNTLGCFRHVKRLQEEFKRRGYDRCWCERKTTCYMK